MNKLNYISDKKICNFRVERGLAGFQETFKFYYFAS